MDDEHSRLLAQIERCRRLASVVVDDEMRHSLEDLAEEYEAQLPTRRKSFMLSGDEGSSDAAGAR